MREPRALAHARRAAALEAARTKAARAHLADAQDLALARIDAHARAERAEATAWTAWGAALNAGPFNLDLARLHGRAFETAQAELNIAEAALRDAEALREAQAVALAQAQGRHKASTLRLGKLKRRLQKRASERALTTLESMTLLRWVRP